MDSDPTVTNPELHRVVLENDRVRVLEYRDRRTVATYYRTCNERGSSSRPTVARVAHSSGQPESERLPSFDAPPVVEVVLSVGFEPIPGLGTVNLARLWNEYRERFPRVEEQAPYVMPLETFGKPNVPSVSLQLFSTPPAPRLWFLDAAGAQLVQVQNNWFARNWRKAPAAPDYPRFPKLSKAFAADIATFADYIRREGLGEIKPVQCEVTYINHVEWPERSSVGNLGAIVALVAKRPQRFRAPAEAQQVTSAYRLLHAGQHVGRIHVSANTARRVSDNADIAVLNITVRGVPLGKDLEGVAAFHRLGRQWALEAFIGLTRDRMHAIWRKRP